MTINYQQPWGQFGPGIPVNPFGAQAGQSFPGMNVPFFPQQFPQGPVGEPNSLNNRSSKIFCA